MFKVICIDDSEAENSKAHTTDGRWIRQGIVYTVIEYGYYPCDDYDGSVYGYVLDELNHWDAFEAHRFIPLSNIDETELLKERQHETCKI